MSKKLTKNIFTHNPPFTHNLWSTKKHIVNYLLNELEIHFWIEYNIFHDYYKGIIKLKFPILLLSLFMIVF